MEKAETKYNDFKGTVAADRADEVSLINWLKEHTKETIEGRVNKIDFGYDDNTPKSVNTLGVTLTIESKEEQNKKVFIEIPVSEFFKYFKRFRLIMTSR